MVSKLEPKVATERIKFRGSRAQHLAPPLTGDGCGTRRKELFLQTSFTIADIGPQIRFGSRRIVTNQPHFNGTTAAQSLPAFKQLLKKRFRACGDRNEELET